MRQIFLVFILLAFFQGIRAQADTSYLYFDNAWSPTGKANAIYYKKIFEEKNEWHRQDFWAKTNTMKMDGVYGDSSLKIKNGVFKAYYENGVLADSAYFEHGKEKFIHVFNEDHIPKAYAAYDKDGNIMEQRGWDESGKEIPGYIYQKVAEFPGGADEWQHYIIVELQKNLPRGLKKGQMWGNVVVSFLILEDGSIDDIKVAQSSGYPELDYHATNIIRNSPKWIPAIQFNRNVIYQQKQTLTYLKPE